MRRIVCASLGLSYCDVGVQKLSLLRALRGKPDKAQFYEVITAGNFRNLLVSWAKVSCSILSL